MGKLLTIWIPTFRRPKQLEALLTNINSLGLDQIADVIVSDNDPDGPLAEAFGNGQLVLSPGIRYSCNTANLTAGVNFLKAFECCLTPWLMIVGDDDLFASSSLVQLPRLLSRLPDSVVAVKFDSDLFGRQPACCVQTLQDYMKYLRPCDYADAFNNLCLISNWLFRCEPCRIYLSSAYLGYSSKISHIFPVLRACALNFGYIQFLPSQPVIHGKSVDDSWPKAATWYEMAMTLSTFIGFIEPSDRKTLLRLLFHSNWLKIVAKCLRIHQFYVVFAPGISVWMIHRQLALLSAKYCIVFLILIPFLLLTAGRYPRYLIEQLGDPGRVDRW